jgi:hypothetical protein
VTGPFLPDLLLSILSFFFLYLCLRNSFYKIFYNNYFLVFLIFWVVCILSSLLSEDILLSLKSSLFFIRIGIFAILISFLIKQDESILKYFYVFFFLTFFILTIDGYYQYFNKYNLLGFPVGTHDRVSSFFGDELILGSYLVRLMPLFIALFIVRESKKNSEKIGFSIILILTSVLIFISGERASMLFFLIGSIFLLIFLSKFKKISFIIFLTIVSIISIILISDSKLNNRYIKSPIESMFGEDPKDKIVFFSETHDSLIRTAWNMFLQKPILGHGPKMYRKKCNDPALMVGIAPCQPHPHNFYIQLLAETGFIGFSFLVGLFIFFVFVILKHTKKYIFDGKIWLSDYKICLFVGLLITIWPITTNGNFFTNHLMILYGLQMGFFIKK